MKACRAPISTPVFTALLSAWVALAGVGAAGCDKSSKDGGKGGAGASGGAAKLGAVERILAAIPIDSEVVLAIDIVPFRENTLIRPFLDKLAKMNTGGFDMQKECGVDPFSLDLKMVLGVRVADQRISGVMNGLPRSKMLPFLDEDQRQATAQGGTQTIDGNYVMMTSAQGNSGLFFAEENTAFLLGGKGAIDKAELDRMAATKAGQGLTGSAQFMDMMKLVDTKAGLWFLVNGNAAFARQAPFQFKAAFGSIDVRKGIDAKIRVRMNSAKDAQSLIDGFGKDIGRLKDMGMASTAGARVDGSDAVIEVVMTNDQVKSLVGMVSAFAGPMLEQMMQGMGGGAGGP